MVSRAIVGGMAPSLAKAPSPALLTRHGLTTTTSSTITGGAGCGGAKSTAATSIIPHHQKAAAPGCSSACYGLETTACTNEAFQSSAAAMSPPPFSYAHLGMQKSDVESTAPAALAVSSLDGFNASGPSDQRRGYAQRLNASFGIFDEVRNGPVMANRSSNAPTAVIKHRLRPVEDFTVSGRDMIESEVGKMIANGTGTVNFATISSAEPIEKSLSASNLGQDANFSADKSASVANATVSISITSVSTTSANVVSNATTSDEEQQKALDERKQKRMISNRESARRSRVRKQQHLDDLRVQVAHLRAENDLMKSKYSMALQHYTRLTEENHVLRSHAIHLSQQLHRLHQAALIHQQAVGNFQSLRIEPELLDPIPITSSYLLNCP
eukprot:c21658_g1_i1 orf=969-2120(-)